MDPERFYLPAYLARYGWISLRLNLPTVNWDEVSELTADSYRLVAPKRLAAAATEANRA
jgi:predicted DNA-binding protein (MmcQ/YjbR family)